MSAIITEKFRLHNAEQFYESFSEAAKSTYYMFIGKSTPYTSGTSGGTDSSPPTPADDVSSEFYYWDDMLAAKLIGSSDTTYASPRRNWANSTTYDMYEHNISAANPSNQTGASNLFDSTFFFITSDFRVYKVLYNLDSSGNKIALTTEPTFTSPVKQFVGGYFLQYI